MMGTVRPSQVSSQDTWLFPSSLVTRICECSQGAIGGDGGRRGCGGSAGGGGAGGGGEGGHVAVQLCGYDTTDPCAPRSARAADPTPRVRRKFRWITCRDLKMLPISCVRNAHTKIDRGQSEIALLKQSQLKLPSPSAAPSGHTYATPSSETMVAIVANIARPAGAKALTGAYPRSMLPPRVPARVPCRRSSSEKG